MTPDHNKEWKYLQHPQIFDPADVINLHESNVFDMVLRDVGDSENEIGNGN